MRSAKPRVLQSPDDRRFIIGSGYLQLVHGRFAVVALFAVTSSQLVHDLTFYRFIHFIHRVEMRNVKSAHGLNGQGEGLVATAFITGLS